MSAFQEGERVILKTRWHEYEQGTEGKVSGESSDILTSFGLSTKYSVKFIDGTIYDIPEDNLESIEEKRRWQEQVIDKLAEIEPLIKTHPKLKEAELKRVSSYWENTRKEAEISNFPHVNKKLIAGNLYCVVAILTKNLGTEKEIKSRIEELANPLGVVQNFFQL